LRAAAHAKRSRQLCGSGRATPRHRPPPAHRNVSPGRREGRRPGRLAISRGSEPIVYRTAFVWWVSRRFLRRSWLRPG
jgi:hypothetical protein